MNERYADYSARVAASEKLAKQIAALLAENTAILVDLDAIWSRAKSLLCVTLPLDESLESDGE